MTDLTPLELAQEAYINVYKSHYGIRPRLIADEQWNDIEWLDRQLQYLAEEAERERNWVPEPEPLSFFEELLTNFKEADYDR